MSIMSASIHPRICSARCFDSLDDNVPSLGYFAPVLHQFVYDFLVMGWVHVTPTGHYPITISQ